MFHQWGQRAESTFQVYIFPTVAMLTASLGSQFQSTEVILSVCVKNSLAGDAGKCLITHSLARNKSYGIISSFMSQHPGWGGL